MVVNCRTSSARARFSSIRIRVNPRNFRWTSTSSIIIITYRPAIAFQVPNIGGQIAIEYSGSTLVVSTSYIVLSDTKTDH